MRFIQRQNRPESQIDPEIISPVPETVGQVALGPALTEHSVEDALTDPSHWSEVSNMAHRAQTRRLVRAEDFQQKLEAGPIERGMKRRLINNGVPANALDVSKALAAVLAEPGAYQKGYTPERDMTGRAKLQAYVNYLPPYLKSGLVFEDIFKAAVELEPLLIQYRDSSTKLSERLATGLENDRAGRFGLARELGRAPDYENEQSLNQVWLRRLLYNPALGGDGLPSRLQAEAKAGAFDDFLAKEIVMAENDEAILDTLDLMRKTIGRELTPQEIDNFCGLTGAWPLEAYRKITEARGSLQQKLENNRLEVAGDLYAIFGGIFNGASPEEYFKKAMERFLQSTKNFKSRPATDRMPQVMRRQVSGREVHAARTAPSSRPESREPKREVANRLLAVDSLGHLSAEDSSRFGEMTARVLENYKGTPGLEQDVSNVLKYLKTVDLQDPMVLRRGGFAKMAEGNVKIEVDGEVKPVPLYRFKPLEAAGLSVKTQIMKRHRVYLGMVDRETLALLGIVHRDKSNQFLASMGIGTGQS